MRRNSILTGPGFGGYFDQGGENAHAAAESKELVLDPATEVAVQPWWSEDSWLWLMNAGVVMPDNVLTLATLTVNHPKLPTAGAAREWPVANWNSSVQYIGTPSDFFGINIVAGRLVYLQPMPFPLFKGSTLRFRSTTNAAGDIRINTIMWIGPQGVFPPGL